MDPFYLIIGPEASSASVGSGVCGAVCCRSEAAGSTAEAEGSPVGGETHQQLLSRCAQVNPVGDGRVLIKRLVQKSHLTFVFLFYLDSHSWRETSSAQLGWIQSRATLWECIHG